MCVISIFFLNSRTTVSCKKIYINCFLNKILYLILARLSNIFHRFWTFDFFEIFSFSVNLRVENLQQRNAGDQRVNLFQPSVTFHIVTSHFFCSAKNETLPWNVLFFNWNSLHARLNNHYKAWSYNKKKYKKIKTYRKSV